VRLIQYLTGEMIEAVINRKIAADKDGSNAMWVDARGLERGICKNQEQQQTTATDD